MTEPIYQDSELLVVSKPSGIALLADRSGATCLWDELRERHGKLYLVHRLDKGTSGVLLIARTQSCQRTLTRLFQTQQIGKFYRARVVGAPEVDASACIELPLKPGRKSRYRVAAQRSSIIRTGNRWHTLEADPDGKPSSTHFRCLKRDAVNSELLLAPKTGRTHQLRVHLAWIGFPIVGDHLYGRPKEPAQQAKRLFLHCRHLQVPGLGHFRDPVPW